jgi:hypothetical protein
VILSVILVTSAKVKDKSPAAEVSIGATES